MNRLRRLLIATATVSSLAMSSGARAQDGEGAVPSEAVPSEAVRLFEEGKRQFDDGAIERACATFAQSADLERTVGVLLNLARCHATMGLIATAHREYVEAAGLAKEQGQTERANAAEALAADLALRLPKVRVQVSGARDGEVVTLDGERLRPGDYGVAKIVDPGEHVVRAEAPEHRPWEKSIDVVDAGQEVVVTVPMLVSVHAPAGEVPSEGGGMGTVRLAGFIVGGVGVATAIVGGVLGGLTLSRVSDAENDPALCPEKVCTPAGRDQIDGARGLGIAATVLLGLGGAAAAAGTVMILVDDGSGGTPTEAEVGLWVSPLSGGLSAGLRF